MARSSVNYSGWAFYGFTSDEEEAANFVEAFKDFDGFVFDPEAVSEAMKLLDELDHGLFLGG
jgi:hypothetical protein